MARFRSALFHQVPPKVEYEISDFGRTLAPILISLRDWGDEYRDKMYAGARDPQAPDVDPASLCAAQTMTVRKTDALRA